VIVYTYKTIPYQESAKLVYGYSEKGLISFLARGVMKMSSPVAFAAEPYRLIDVTLTSSALPTLKDATLINRFDASKKDLVKTLIHHVIGEILQKNIAPEDDHKKLLGLLMKVFERIDQDPDPLKYLALFQLKCLYFLGFGLHLKKCAICDQQTHLGYDLYHLETRCETHGALPHHRALHTLLISYLLADLTTDEIAFLDDPLPVLEALGRLYVEHLDFHSKALKELVRLLKKETL